MRFEYTPKKIPELIIFYSIDDDGFPEIEELEINEVKLSEPLESAILEQLGDDFEKEIIEYHMERATDARISTLEFDTNITYTQKG